MAAQLFYGSINLTELIEKAKEKHSAFTKGKNGKVYVNISVWLNEEEDKYGNVMSLKLSASKEHIAKDEEAGKIYIGNCKVSDNAGTPLSTKDAEAMANSFDDLPF